jgi:hypothetical protein
MHNPIFISSELKVVASDNISIADDLKSDLTTNIDDLINEEKEKEKEHTKNQE